MSHLLARGKSKATLFAGFVISILFICVGHFGAAYNARLMHQSLNAATATVAVISEVRSSLLDLHLSAAKAISEKDTMALEQHKAIINELLLSLEVAQPDVVDTAIMAEARMQMAHDLRLYEQSFFQAYSDALAQGSSPTQAIQSLSPNYVNLQFRAERLLLDANQSIEQFDGPANRIVLISNLSFGSALILFGGLVFWMWQRWRGSMKIIVASADAERSRFRDLALATADWFIELDADLRVAAVSEPPAETTEVPFIVECAIGMNLEEAVSGGEGLKSNWAPCLLAFHQRKAVRRFRYIVANPLLGTRHYELNGLPHFDTQSRFLGYRLAVADITDMIETLAARDATTQILSAFFEHSPAMISVKDVEGRYTALNQAAEVTLGLSRETAIGQEAILVLKPDLAEKISEEDARVMESEETMTFEHEIWVNGSLRTFQTTRFPVLDAVGCLNGVGAIGVDVTDRHKAEREVQRRANFDNLTDLPNRHLFQDRLTQGLAAAKRTGQSLAVLHVNLDDFRAANDIRGQQIGDQILVETAWRIKSCLRDTDTVARLTADEFGVMLTNIEKSEDVGLVARKIIDAISEAISIDDMPCYITAGIGYTTWPDGGETAEDLTRHADIALHRAKRSGAGRIVHYSADIGDALKQHQIIAQSLKSAVASKEFFVMYQPLVDAITHEVVAAEALLRWENRDLGLVRPDRFIPIAEESDVIIDIGNFILQRACRDAVAWNERRGRAVAVSVNVSPKQMLHDDFVSIVMSVLSETGLPANLLKIEVTESGLMENVEKYQSIFSELRTLGVKISLDDFGTGYSALGYLQKFEFDALKLDRSFIRDINVSGGNTTVAESIIAMAQRLGLTIVAEGVESPEQLEFLRTNGCDQIQGFYFSPPKKLGEFTSYVMQQDLAKAA